MTDLAPNVEGWLNDLRERLKSDDPLVALEAAREVMVSFGGFDPQAETDAEGPPHDGESA